ncbi:hypothetical protein GCM10010174_25910 [Kutzneria viridogrisea]
MVAAAAEPTVVAAEAVIVVVASVVVTGVVMAGVARGRDEASGDVAATGGTSTAPGDRSHGD